MSEAMSTGVRPVLGWTGFVAGAAALLLAISMFWGAPFLPQPEQVAEPSLAERTKEAVSALFGMGGEEATPVPPAEPQWSVADLYALLSLVVVGLGSVAVVLGLAGFARHESKRPAFSAVTLGGGAILFQLVTWVILVVICVMLIGTAARTGDGIGDILHGILQVFTGIISGIGEFFSNLFGGLFGN